jgi:hypothetical protein
MAENNTKVRLQTGARQTMGSWVKPIANFAEVPPAYKDAIHRLRGAEKNVPLMVLAPPVDGEKSPRCEKLLLWLDETLYILENHDGTIQQISFPKKDLGYLEVGRVLLYSWFTVTGINSEGESASNTVVYNTATHRHVQPFFNALRSLSGIPFPRNRRAFNYLAHQNFKFFNFAKNSLKGEEEVLATILQPEVTRNLFSSILQGNFSHLVINAHLTILTELELIFIEEDPENLQRNGNRYGGIWYYVPLENLLAISETKREDTLLNLSFKIKPNISLERVYAEPNHKKALLLKENLEGLLKG